MMEMGRWNGNVRVGNCWGVRSGCLMGKVVCWAGTRSVDLLAQEVTMVMNCTCVRLECGTELSVRVCFCFELYALICYGTLYHTFCLLSNVIAIRSLSFSFKSGWGSEVDTEPPC